jgi:hypothetical protein
VPGDLLTFVEQTEEDFARLKTRLEHVVRLDWDVRSLGALARLKVRWLAQVRLTPTQLRSWHDFAVRVDIARAGWACPPCELTAPVRMRRSICRGFVMAIARRLIYPCAMGGEGSLVNNLRPNDRIIVG